MKFGLPGSADIIGISHDRARDYGRFIAIEVKTGEGRLSEDQVNFRNMIMTHKGIHIVARCLKDVTIHFRDAARYGVRPLSDSGIK